MSLVARNLAKSHHQAERKIEILKGLSLEVAEGESVAIVGKSGSGKSTLLSLLAGLSPVDEGQILLSGHELTGMSETELARLRARHMGIIFQQFQLVSTLTALENIMLPAEILRLPDAFERAQQLLERVGLSERRHHFPQQLSGGEQQRVAIARALCASPSVLLADEPTGNLDTETAKAVTPMLFDLAKENKTALILVTHDPELAQRCSRVLRLEGGKLHA